MSLSSALISAKSVFTTTGQQTALASKNIANVKNADYARRMAMLGTSLNGAQVLTIQRAQNDALLKQNVASISQASAQGTLFAGLQTLKSALGGNDYETAPSTYLASFRDALQTYAATPGNTTIAATVVSAAGDLVTSLNRTSAAVQDLRLDADKEIASSVTTLNGLLSDFETVNVAVQSALNTGGDAGDALDQRDKLLKQISEIVGISTVTRGSGDTVIYTTDGTVLFENKARQVTFTSTANFDAATTGNGIYVDGVPMKAGEGGNTSGQGSLSALLQLRDDIAPKFQEQLDETARALVTLFQEGDPSGSPPIPYAPGLFTYATSTPPATIPAVGAATGLAAKLIVNPDAKTNPQMIRDGGFNGVVANTDGASGFSALLDGFISAFDGNMAFDPATNLNPSTTIMSFATSSVGWLEELRSSASTGNDNKSALLARTQDALSSLTGVSMDEEVSLLLDLEQSYKAAAKLVSTVDAMMAALLEAVR